MEPHFDLNKIALMGADSFLVLARGMLMRNR
mgnify:CR=1 FL=1|jgi:hypothetical protein